MKRKFTVQTVRNSIIHQLSVVDLKRMQFEYPEVYNELFFEQAELLEQVLTRKMQATRHLEGQRQIKKLKMDYKAFKLSKPM